MSDPPKLYIPTETEGIVHPPPAQNVFDPGGQADQIAHAQVKPTPNKLNLVSSMIGRGLLDASSKPSLLAAFDQGPQPRTTTVQTWGQSALTPKPHFDLRFKKGDPAPDILSLIGEGSPEQMETRWSDGILKAKTKAENDIFDRMSARLGFDVRGELTLPQKVAVRHIARTMRKEMHSEHGTVTMMEHRARATRELINLLDTTHERRADVVQKVFPLHYRRFYPKDIVVPSGYYDPRLLTGPFICADIMRMDYEDGQDESRKSPKQQVQGIAIAGHLWNRIKCPTFFLSKGLAEAIDATDLPDEYAPPPLKWPLPAFAVMMAGGMLQFVAPDGQSRDVAAILYSRMPRAEPLKIGRPVFDNGIFDRMYAETWTCVDIVADPPVDPDDPSAGLQLLSFILSNGDTVTREFLDNQPMDFSDNRFVLGGTSEDSGPLRNETRQLMLYALKLLVVLQHSPDLVGRESDVVHEPGRARRSRFDPNAKWSPNFMGRGYRMRGAGGEAGDGSMPPHLRRGHARRQRYGEGRKLVKDIWIPPCFVNAKKWKPGDPIIDPTLALG